MRIAYAVPGAVSTAFAPVPAYDGRGCGPWANGQNVHGQPGTQGVPAGLGDFGAAGLQVNGASVRGGGAGYASGSGTMPLVWYPQLYYQRTLLAPGEVSGNTQAMSVWSDNQMPVPAADPVGRAAIMGLPPVFVADYARKRDRQSRWPSWLPSAGYGQ